MEKRNYTKSLRFYISHIFKKWKPTTWIFFILAVIALIFASNITINYLNEGIFCIGSCKNVTQTIRYVDNNNYIPLDYEEIALSYSDIKEVIPLYEDTYYKNLKLHFNFANVDLFIPEYDQTKNLIFGRCNKERTDCFIYNKYKIDNYQDEEICNEADLDWENPIFKPNNLKTDGECKDSWPPVFELRFDNPFHVIKDSNRTLYQIQFNDYFNNSVYFDKVEVNDTIVYGYYNYKKNLTYIYPKYKFEGDSNVSLVFNAIGLDEYSPSPNEIYYVKNYIIPYKVSYGIQILKK